MHPPVPPPSEHSHRHHPHGPPPGTPHPEPGPHGPVPPARLPPFCLTLVVVCVGVFLVQTLGGDLTTTRLPDGRELPLSPLALFGPLVRWGEWWRVLGTVVVHGGALHLLFNMSAVWTLGGALERGLGTARMVLVSLISALGAATMVLLVDFDQPTVGASGMILGWAGVMLPLATREMRRELGAWLVQIAVISLLPFVSWSGHLGGFLAGALAGLLMRWSARRGPVAFWTTEGLLLVALALATWAAARSGGLG